MNVSIECRLKKILEQKGWTQLALATKAGLRPSTVGDLCNKEIDRIYMSTLERICEVLDIDVGELLIIRQVKDKTAC